MWERAEEGERELEEEHCKSLVLTFHLNVPDIYLMYTNLHLVDIFFHLFSLFV